MSCAVRETDSSSSCVVFPHAVSYRIRVCGISDLVDQGAGNNKCCFNRLWSSEELSSAGQVQRQNKPS